MGVGFTGTLPAQATGEALQENLSNGGAIVCSAIADGLLVEEEPSENLSMAVAEKILTLAGVEVGELTGAALLCKPEKTCEAGMEAEVYPDSLPWLFYIDLHVETGETEKLYVLLVGLHGEKLPSYEIDCLVFGLLIEELCSAADEAEG